MIIIFASQWSVLASNVEAIVWLMILIGMDIELYELVRWVHCQDKCVQNINLTLITLSI